MKVPLLDLSAQLETLRPEIHEAVAEVIDSCQYIMGPKVEELEGKVQEYLGISHAVGVSSGTDALLVVLMAYGVGPGDIVVTSPYSFFATAGVVARLNAIPAFVDIDPHSYNMDPALLAQWFIAQRKELSHVKAIMPVHLYGQSADMEAILDIGKEYGVPVIEDGAQAIGTTYPTKHGVKKVCTMGDVGCLSFFPSKNLGGVGDGGMVVTNNAAVAEKIRLLRNHGAKPKYFHSMIGGNFRLDPIQAAVLSVKAPHLERWHARRRENAKLYDELLDIPQIKRPLAVYGREHHIYNQYVISVNERRDELRAFLAKNDIGTEVYYPVPFHEQECFKYLGNRLGDFAHSEYAARHTLALPIYPELTREMCCYVAEKVKAFFV